MTRLTLFVLGVLFVCQGCTKGKFGEKSPPTQQSAPPELHNDGARGLAEKSSAATPAEEQKAKGKKCALLVGVKEYGSSKFTSLEYTENDVEKMAAVLKARAGFDEIRLLTSTRGGKSKGDAPTAANIRKALAGLLAKKGKGDTVLIAFSGHGVQLEVEDGNGKAKSIGYFCPSDSDLTDAKYETGKSESMLNIAHLFDDLGNCGASAKLVIMDACRNEVSARSLDMKRVNIPEGVAALFSCMPGQRAFESKKLKHGVFFHHLIEGIEGKAADRRGRVTWGSLSEYVTEEVQKKVPELIGGGAKQTPHEIKNIVGEAPVLIDSAGAEKLEKEKPNLVKDTIARFEVGQLWTGDITIKSTRSEKHRLHMVITQVGKEEQRGRATFLGLCKQGEGTWFEMVGQVSPAKDGKQLLEYELKDTSGKVIQRGEATKTGKDIVGNSTFEIGKGTAELALSGKPPVKTKHGMNAGQSWVGMGKQYYKGKVVSDYNASMIVVRSDDRSFEGFFLSADGANRALYRVVAELDEVAEGKWTYKHWSYDLAKPKEAPVRAEGSLNEGGLACKYNSDRNQRGEYTLQLAKPKK